MMGGSIRVPLSKRKYVSIGITNGYFAGSPRLIDGWTRGRDAVRHEFCVERIDILNKHVNGARSHRSALERMDVQPRPVTNERHVARIVFGFIRAPRG